MKSHQIDNLKEVLHLSTIIGYIKNSVLLLFTALARLVIRKYKPRIIGVTGSVGKTSTKDLIFSILKSRELTWKSVKSYNSDFGVPLAILGLETGWRNPIKWALNVVRASTFVLFRRNYPKLLVLEIGADKPGDIRDIVKWVKPNVAVLTSMGTTPVHVEFFSSPEEVAKEKSELVKSLDEKGIAILNIDDERVYAMRELTKARIVTYGFSKGADFRGGNDEITYDPDTKRPTGMTFRVDYAGNSLPIRIKGVLGRGQLYVALAAFATAVTEGFSPLEAITAIESNSPTPGRARIISGNKNTTIIDDTYNSSPVAVSAAIEVVQKIKNSGRKIIVLGDMMELGQYTKDEHEKVGREVAKFADNLFVVGPRANFAGDAARVSGMRFDQVHVFDDSRECGVYLDHFIKEGDLILVKGSQSVRLERVVEEIMAEPEMAGSLLVRQDKEWKRR